MKNIYNISKGQLITVWFFGVIGWFLTLEETSGYYGSGFAEFLAWLIPFALIFYTIGWKNDKKSKK